MATKHASMLDRPDFEYLRSENDALREELEGLRDETERERESHQQLLENFQVCHNEDTRKLREAKKVVDNLGRENAQLRQELMVLQDRNSVESESSVGAQILKELSSSSERFAALQSDLRSNSLMRNIHGKHGIIQDDVDSLVESFSRMNTELANLRSMLSLSKGNLTSNTQLVASIRQGSRTTGASSNSYDGNITSDTDDLVHISGPITENAVSRALQHRMAAGKCVTKMGSILVSVNGYDPYTQVGVLPNPQDTHLIHTTVNQVIERLSDAGPPQVFVLSGCSGSGKSFLSQVLVRQILEQAEGALETEISKHFLSSYCVMQSLSYAQTISNSNSSRVGQLLEFYFSEGTVTKTKMQCFPLDATRIINSFPGERNFHIFYQLLAGITQEERAKLHLQGYSVHTLHYLNQSPLPSEDQDVIFRAKFERWRTGLAVLGIPFMDVLRVLVAILLLGNVQFVEGEGMELDVKGNNEIKAVAALLGVSGVSLYRGLTTKTKNLRGQVFRSLCEPSVANLNRDSLAMALYLRTLAAIIRRINSFKRSSTSSMISGSPQGSSESVRSQTPTPVTPDATTKPVYTNGILTTPPPGQPGWSTTNGVHDQTYGASGLVAVMDMFGFESSEVNRLEQICVNLCSETIQHFYNTHIFKSTEDYCREEGVLGDIEIDYVDIAACIELLTCQRAGILTLLDKESLFARGTCQGFLQKVKSNHADSECFFDPDPDPNGSSFAVCHYAGNVVYETPTLLETNRDSIPDDIVCVFSRQNCNFGFATHLFTSDLKTQQGQTASPKGLLHRIAPSHGPELNSSPSIADLPPSTFSQDFQGKLDGLLKTLVPAQPVFIRCIKSNSKEVAGLFDREAVNQQLRVLQVFETLQLLQTGFAHHSRFQVFIQKYGCLFPSRNPDLQESGPEHCNIILESQLRAADRTTAERLLESWVLGKKYVFYSEAMKQHLDVECDKKREAAVLTLQAHVRRWFSQKQWPGLRRSLEMQKKARSAHSRTNMKPSRPSLVPTDHELRVDTKTAEQTCCLYGLDMETPPPVPKSRLYTVKGNMKMGFPQTRIMKRDLPGSDGELLLRKGEVVKVVSASRKRGFLIVEHKNGSTIQVPHQMMDLKQSPNPSPR